MTISILLSVLPQLINSKIYVYLQLIRGVKVRPTPQDQAKQKHGSQEKGGSSDLKAGPEEGGAATADAGGCKGESPHGASRSRQEAASMNQMAVSTWKKSAFPTHHSRSS